MPGCLAPKCSNHSRKGARLFRFPASPTRRAKWVQNCGIVPGKWSTLCEKHFDDNQYETAVIKENGSRKLRRTAIPTIFNVLNSPQQLQRNQPVSSFVDQKQIIDPAADPALRTFVDHNYSFDLSDCSFDTTAELKVSPHLDVAECNKISELPTVPTIVEYGSVVQLPSDVFVKEENEVSEDDPNDEDSNRILDNNKFIIAEQQRKIWRLQKAMTKLRKENKRLKFNLKRKIVRLSFLTKDQQKTLLSGKRIQEWSPEAISHARQIRSVVGSGGYKHLVQKGFQLPSYSTLCRKADLVINTNK